MKISSQLNRWPQREFELLKAQAPVGTWSFPSNPKEYANHLAEADALLVRSGWSR